MESKSVLFGDLEKSTEEWKKECAFPNINTRSHVDGMYPWYVPLPLCSSSPKLIRQVSSWEKTSDKSKISFEEHSLKYLTSTPQKVIKSKEGLRNSQSQDPQGHNN